MKTSLKRYNDSGFALTIGKSTVAFDIGEFTPKEMIAGDRIDAMFVSHGHPDHCSPDLVGLVGATTWAPADASAVLLGLAPEVREIRPGAPVELGDVTVLAHNVDHGTVSNPISNFGFEIQLPDGRILFPGDIGRDTEPHPQGTFDLILLPIGGTYVFDPKAAVDYLLALGHRGAVLPIHWDYAPETTQEFRALCGETWNILDIPWGESRSLHL